MGHIPGKAGTVSLIRETAEPESPEAWGSHASCSMVPSVLSFPRVEAGCASHPTDTSWSGPPPFLHTHPTTPLALGLLFLELLVLGRVGQTGPIC